jgi:hypothetical protein
MTTIKLKNGSGAPTAGDLVVAEPALDLTNKRLYTEDSGGTVIEVGTNPTSVTTGDITATGTATFAGLTTTGDLSFGDNDKAIFGAGSDLQLYHDGSTSFIDDVGTGNLHIRTDGASIKLRTSANADMIVAENGGAAKLYHAGSQKLATLSTGIDVSGTVTADGLTVDGSATIQASSSPALIVKDTTNNAEARLQAFNSTATVGTQSNHSFSIETNDTNRALFASSGDISFYEDTGTTPKFEWSASNERLVLSTSGAYALDVKASGTSSATMAQFSNSNGSDKAAIRLDANGDGELVLIDAGNNEDVVITAGGSSYFNGGSVGINQSSPTRKLHVTSDGSGTVAVFGDSANNNTVEVTRTTTNASYVGLSATSAAGGIIAGPTFKFSTCDSGGGSVTERMRIDSSGNLLVGTTDSSIETSSSTEGVNILPDKINVARSAGVTANFNRISTDGNIVQFRKDGSTVGSISVTASATAYNTSSDQRLKDNIVDAPSASDDIDAIQVRSFDWKADGSHQKYGMVAQELQSVAPEAVSEGETEEDMMGVDYSKLVPMLVKEIQSLRARVAQLEGAN